MGPEWEGRAWFPLPLGSGETGAAWTNHLLCRTYQLAAEAFCEPGALRPERARRATEQNQQPWPRHLGGASLSFSEQGLCVRAAVAESRAFPPRVFAARSTASATAPPPSATAANTLNEWCAS